MMIGRKKKEHNPYWDVKMGFFRRLVWIFTYYRLQILCIVTVLVVAGYVLYLALRPSKDSILNVGMINAISVTETDLFETYLKEAGYDTDTYTASVSNTTQILFDGSDPKAWDKFELLTAQLFVGEYDLFYADGAIFNSLAVDHAFLDVSEYMTPEQIEDFDEAGLILYVTDTDTGEQMPCGVVVRPGTPVVNRMYYLNTCYLGIPTTYFNDEETMKVIQLVLRDLL